ncbi:hypothetical protein SEA_THREERNGTARJAY_185 [Mycobacterium phage ThreeRngTarjay]|nr:hypothetical protein CONSTELLA_182 [Mycobacterium phage Constella]QBI99881.1 hypothetical protein SEA_THREERNGTARJAY_185 [Mycobacterium phage ThreeRngTarjay]
MEDEDLDADRNDCAHGVEGPCPVCLPELFEDDPGPPPWRMHETRNRN